MVIWYNCTINLFVIIIGLLDIYIILKFLELQCKDNVDNYETTSIMETVDLQIVISHSRLLRCRKNDSAINYNLSSNTFMILYVKRKDIWGSLIKLKDSLLL